MKVYKNKSLRRKFGPKGRETTTNLRNLHNELHNSYSSSTIIEKIKSRRMRGVRHVAHMGKQKKSSKILTGNLKERIHLKTRDIERIILKQI
jgi:hypothetical protein